MFISQTAVAALLQLSIVLWGIGGSHYRVDASALETIDVGSSRINLIDRDLFNRIWIGTNKGVRIWKNGILIPDTELSRVGWVKALAFSKHQTAIATHRQIVLVNSSSLEIVNRYDLPVSACSIAWSGSKLYYASTKEGLFLLDDPAPKLIEQDIKQVGQCSQGHLWIQSLNRLAHFDPRDDLDVAINLVSSVSHSVVKDGRFVTLSGKSIFEFNCLHGTPLGEAIRHYDQSYDRLLLGEGQIDVFNQDEIRVGVDSYQLKGMPNVSCMILLEAEGQILVGTYEMGMKLLRTNRHYLSLPMRPLGSLVTMHDNKLVYSIEDGLAMTDVSLGGTQPILSGATGLTDFAIHDETLIWTSREGTLNWQSMKSEKTFHKVDVGSPLFDLEYDSGEEITVAGYNGVWTIDISTEKRRHIFQRANVECIKRAYGHLFVGSFDQGLFKLLLNGDTDESFLEDHSIRQLEFDGNQLIVGTDKALYSLSSRGAFNILLPFPIEDVSVGGSASFYKGGELIYCGIGDSIVSQTSSISHASRECSLAANTDWVFAIDHSSLVMIDRMAFSPLKPPEINYYKSNDRQQYLGDIQKIELGRHDRWIEIGVAAIGDEELRIGAAIDGNEVGKLKENKLIALFGPGEHSLSVYGHITGTDAKLQIVVESKFFEKYRPATIIPVGFLGFAVLFLYINRRSLDRQNRALQREFSLRSKELKMAYLRIGSTEALNNVVHMIGNVTNSLSTLSQEGICEGLDMIHRFAAKNLGPKHPIVRCATLVKRRWVKEKTDLRTSIDRLCTTLSVFEELAGEVPNTKRLADFSVALSSYARHWGIEVEGLLQPVFIKTDKGKIEFFFEKIGRLFSVRGITVTKFGVFNIIVSDWKANKLRSRDVLHFMQCYLLAESITMQYEHQAGHQYQIVLELDCAPVRI